ncbi:sensor histidine kinase [Kutzneria albida]|uniref:histidine kinase n=1 Tax=Kutzneria albida DSM 43870 TaxID=1449976 RepID=W5WML3_9PSEU|nr:histidine kinase [Kutzneria albida]AHI02098.1 hypothetical protein KALB_8741 [Kutzneria albida DSM 43870]
MENQSLSWPVLARRQWPLALALAAILALETSSTLRWDEAPWGLPVSLLASVLAVLSPRRPVDAALAVAVLIAGSSVLLRVLEIRTSTWSIGLYLTEFAAVMAIIAITVRQAGRLRAALMVLALTAATVMAQLLRPSMWPGPGRFSLTNSVVWSLLLAIAIGTGLYFRARDRERRTAEANSVAAAQQAERLALARELHDVVAHYVTGMIVHAQAAESVADKDPTAPRAALPIITASGNEALTAMRRLVGSLRGAEPSGTTSKDNGELAEQIGELVRQVGGPVRLTVDLADPVPPELGRSVLRLVQESLTNARKHAVDLTRIDVDVRSSGQVVRVRVADDGSGQQVAPVGGSGGFGLVGMRERAELLGGRFQAGPLGGRGWLVEVELPTTR